MDGLVKIRDVSAKYSISARTLRYYEDMGLINSTRSDDYTYRLYDEAAMQRLEQILILRKLNISVKDIQRIFNTSGSEVVLEVLGKKVDAIDEEVSLLHELKEIVLDFIRQIEQADFGKESDIKLLYEKAKEIETQIANVDYNGNPSTVNRLLEVTEQLDRKIPDIMIVRIPCFRAVTSGLLTFDEIFGGEFGPWQEAHNHFFKPIIFNSPDFLYGKDGKAAWIWALKDEITEADTQPYEIIEYPGGLYAVSVSIDGDGESHNKVREKTEKWLENTNFVIDNNRELAGHMIYVDDEIKEGLGYHQMNLYAPIKLKREVSDTK
jgi:DNA-binding transcriptional MerR regulator